MLNEAIKFTIPYSELRQLDQPEFCNRSKEWSNQSKQSDSNLLSESGSLQQNQLKQKVKS